MRLVGRVLFGALPAICLAAITWYAWPRSDVTPKLGSVITAGYPCLLWVPVGLLVGHCLVYVVAWSAWERPVSGIARTVWRAALITLGFVALNVVGLLLIFGLPFLVALPLLSVAPALTLFLALGVAGAFLFMTSRVARRAWVYAAAVGPLAVIMSPIVLPVYYFGSHPWRHAAQLPLPDGRVYHVQRFWESDVLTRELSRDALFLRTQVIAGSYSEYLSVALVRPAQPGYEFARNRVWKDGGRLVRSTDGGIIAFIYGFHSYSSKTTGCATDLVYNLSTGQRWSTDDNPERLFTVSPFVLLGPTDRLNTGDVQAMRPTMTCQAVAYSGQGTRRDRSQ